MNTRKTFRPIAICLSALIVTIAGWQFSTRVDAQKSAKRKTAHPASSAKTDTKRNPSTSNNAEYAAKDTAMAAKSKEARAKSRCKMKTET